MTIRWYRGISRVQNRSKLFSRSVKRVSRESFTRQPARDKKRRRRYDDQAICLLQAKVSGATSDAGARLASLKPKKGSDGRWALELQ